MKERAFRAVAWEAKGLHDGSITRVVRVVDPQPDVDKRRHRWAMSVHDGLVTWGKAPWRKTDPHNYIEEGRAVSPFGVVGDRLWVGEEWYYDVLGVDVTKEPPGKHREATYYRADGECCQQIPECCCGEVGPTPWASPEQMPRWASRTILDVTDVRVVRAQEVEWKDMEFTGLWTAFAEYRDESCVNRDCAEVLGRLRVKYFRKLIGEDVFDVNSWLWLGTVAKVEA